MSMSLNEEKISPADSILLTLCDQQPLKVAEIKDAVTDIDPEDLIQTLSETDAKGRTPLHLLATTTGAEDAIEAIFTKTTPDQAAVLILARDADGNSALHLAAAAPLPMACFQLACQAPQAVLEPRSTDNATAIDLALRNGSSEALNALLLACAGCVGITAMKSIKLLVKSGAIPDTWAPSGLSSLMLAAAANNEDGCRILIESGASVELQDSFGRNALMWAAGSAAPKTLQVLLHAGACVATRDRRGKTAADYAADYPDAKAVMDEWVKELERRAEVAQEALLAELMEEEERKAVSKANKKAKKKAAKNKKKGSTVDAEHQPADATADVSLISHKSVALLGKSTTAASKATLDDSHTSNKTALATEEEEEQDATAPSSSPSDDGTTPAAVAACSLPSSSTSPHRNSNTSSGADQPPRPPSPEWCTVGAKGSAHKPLHQTSNSGVGTVGGRNINGAMSAPNKGPHHSFAAAAAAYAATSTVASASAPSAGHHPHHPHHHLLQPSSSRPHHPHHRRQHSGCSATSTSSSLVSHDTDASLQSGQRSDRCVLRRAGTSTGTATPPMVPQPASNTSGLSTGAAAASSLMAWRAGSLAFSRGTSVIDEGIESFDAYQQGDGSSLGAGSGSDGDERHSDGDEVVGRLGNGAGTWASVAAGKKSTPLKLAPIKTQYHASGGAGGRGSNGVDNVIPVPAAVLSFAAKVAAQPTRSSTATTGAAPATNSVAFKSQQQKQQKPNAATDVAAKAAAPSPPVAATPPGCAVTPAASGTNPQTEDLISTLRSDIHRLRIQLAAVELAHRQEIAAVLQDAARHESDAVARAVQESRNDCIVRFAGFLQNHGPTLATALPAIFAGGNSGNGTMPLSPSCYQHSHHQQQHQHQQGNVFGRSTNQHSLSSLHPHELSPPPPSDTSPMASFLDSMNNNNHTTTGDTSNDAASRNVSTSVEEHDDDAVLASLGFPPNPIIDPTDSTYSNHHQQQQQHGCLSVPLSPLSDHHSHHSNHNYSHFNHTHHNHLVDDCGGCYFDATSSASPLSTSPFSYEVGEFLREEFTGNHSAFVAPSSEAETTRVLPSLWAATSRGGGGGGSSAEWGVATSTTPPTLAAAAGGGASARMTTPLTR